MREPVSVGDTAETVYEDLQREDLVKFAGASGDFNPIHYDEPFAKSAGYPSVFGQGMYTAALVSNLVDEWFGVDSLETYHTRFVGQTWPDDDIVVTGEVTDVTEDGDETVVELDLTAENGDGEPLVTGGATVRVSA